MAEFKKSKDSQTFLDYPSSLKLKRFASNPVDLTASNCLTVKRFENFISESSGYFLSYATERVDELVIEELGNLAKESRAVEKMEEMQAGKVLNFIAGFPSENRSVLHTATRDFFDEPQTSTQAVEAANQAKEEIEKLKKFIKTIDADNTFTDMVCIAIGGSDLGPRANYLALQPYVKKGRRVHFISNVDPDDAATVLKDVDLSRSLVLVVSKTGTTLETLSNEQFVREKFQQAGISPEKHFISVTSAGSPMDTKDKYLECFHMWDWVGGRFSTTSMVGGVMLSFACGFERYWEFLQGAHAMDKAALQREVSKNIPLLAALLAIWNHNFLGYSTLAIIPYSQALARYPAHIQQVEMESNGKRIDQNGNPTEFQTAPVIWGEPGTNAQHSFYQLIHQGTEVIPVEFIGYKESQWDEDCVTDKTTLQEKLLSNLFAQAIALAQGHQDSNPNKTFLGNRPSHFIMGKKLTPYALGALLAFYEHKSAFQGFIWGINSFDQEGVQLGKVLAQRVLNEFIAFKDEREGSFPLGNTLIRLTEKL